jgi:signal transduction histidine kinase
MALERGVRLETRVSAGVLEAGPLPLYGVVSNAVRNAIEASPEGGLVMVSALVAGGDDGRVLVVEVRDGGAGLSEGALARAFEAGWSGKEGGVGVGLSMSREVVEGLGGRIWLERDGSAGETVLRVEVPLEREPSGRCGGGGADGRLIG